MKRTKAQSSRSGLLQSSKNESLCQANPLQEKDLQFQTQMDSNANAASDLDQLFDTPGFLSRLSDLWGRKKIHKGAWATTIVTILLTIIIPLAKNHTKFSALQRAAASTSSFSNEEGLVKDCLKEALVFETETIYVHPEDFTNKYERRLSSYWVRAEDGGQAILLVKKAVDNLLKHAWRYNTNTSLNRLDFVSVQVSGDFAHAKTREFWYLPVVDGQGLLLPNRVFEHYFEPDYDLEKMDGRWLILKTTAPYATHNDSGSSNLY